MREHPIPQDITNYKFHLIGSMTIKQFAELFAGVILALLTNASNLIVIVKYPLAIFFVILGVMLAFVPIEERPLDHWIVTFFKVLYKPTKFFWKKTPKIPEAFTYESKKNQEELAPQVDLSPLKRERIREYLSSVEPQQTADAWELSQKQEVANVLAIFDQTPTTNQQTPANKGYKPQLKTRVRNIAIPQQQQQETVVFDQSTPAATTVNINNLNLQTQAPAETYVSNDNMIASEQVATEVAIPEMESISVNGNTKEAEEERLSQTQYQPEERVFSQTQEDQNLEVTQEIYMVNLNDQLPFPDKPQQPNQLAGMVFNPQGKILTNTIVEISNESGQVVRAVKTNPLGQFYISTPLDNGRYYINLEKKDHRFYTFVIDLQGERVPPMEIYSQN